MADEPSDTEAAILDAALHEVLAHGIRRTTVSDIARRCGLSRQTVYRYWPDAQSIFAALVTRELLGVIPVAPVGDDTLEGTVRMFVETADRIRQMPLVGRLRDTDPELFARYILSRLGTSQRAIHVETARRLEAGQAAGDVRGGDPVQLAAMVLLIAQSAVQSAPIVAEWLPAAAWRTELAAALTGYLRPDS